MKTRIYCLLITLCMVGCKKEYPISHPRKTEPRTIHKAITSEESNDVFPKSGKTIDDFVIDNAHIIHEQVYGDLDGDNVKDAVLLVEPMGGDAARTILVLLKKGGIYELLSKNETIMGRELTEDGYKIHFTENIEIKDHKLSIELYGSAGPTGNTLMEFVYSKGKLSLTSFSTYNSGAGEILETKFDAASKTAKVISTNTLKDEMPETIEKSKLDYKDLDFDVFESGKLEEAILNSKKEK